MSLVIKDGRSSFHITVSAGRNLRKVCYALIAKYFLQIGHLGHRLEGGASGCRFCAAWRDQSTRPVELDDPKMPRYFFHVRDGVRSFDDSEGEILSGVVAAKAKAAQIARELAADEEAYRSYRVVVTDATGNEIASRMIALSCPVNSQ
jgi:hypothetical protein